MKSELAVFSKDLGKCSMKEPKRRLENMTIGTRHTNTNFLGARTNVV